MSSKCQMWLTHNNGQDKIRFPVLPELFSVRKGSANTSVNVQGLGELVIKQDPAAMMITFSCFFPASLFPGVQFANLASPESLRDRIFSWMDSPTPCQFIVTGINGVNITCSVEDFSPHERGGDVGTLHYSIILKEVRNVEVRQISAQAAPARADTRAPERTHAVVSGDNLWTLARRFLGNGLRQGEIFSLNREAIEAEARRRGRSSSNNGWWIFPGTVLRIPVK